jgi:tetratricopeptide (TPR) repeat protein
MRLRSPLVVCIFIALAGCATLGTQTDFGFGRQALMRGEPDNALRYFERVAAAEPNYVYKAGVLRESIWTYIGRAHYNSGKYVEAKVAFNRALQQFNDEHLARLYSGLLLLRPTPAKSAMPANPFTLQEVTYALREGIEPRRVAALARQRGVGFDLSKETESQLTNAGADTALLSDIRKIRADITGRGSANDTQIAQGAKEIRAALAGLEEWMNYTIYNTPQGQYWDPGGDIRKSIKNGLALFSARQLDIAAIVANGELLAYQFTEEPDRASRDQSQDIRRRLQR